MGTSAQSIGQVSLQKGDIGVRSDAHHALRDAEYAILNFSMFKQTLQKIVWALIAAVAISPSLSGAIDLASSADAVAGAMAHAASVGITAPAEAYVVPDCDSQSDCNDCMSVAGCSMTGLSCSACGVSALSLLAGAAWSQLDVHAHRPDQLRLVMKDRSVSIFHPPRVF